MISTVLMVLALVGAAAPAIASPATTHATQTAIQTATVDEFTAQRRYRTIATRLEVYPSSRQVRRCIDWYQIERRPTSTVLTPQMRCWWAKR